MSGSGRFSPGNQTIAIKRDMSAAIMPARPDPAIPVDGYTFGVVTMAENSPSRFGIANLPGRKGVWHTHLPKVSYIISGGMLRITPEGGGSFVVEDNSGGATWMGAVGPHFGENIGTTPVRIALVEVKSLNNVPFEDIGRRD